MRRSVHHEIEMTGERRSFRWVTMRAAEEVVGPPLFANRGTALLYQMTVNYRLEVRVKPWVEGDVGAESS
jgi:hypothetical protein